MKYHPIDDRRVAAEFDDEALQFDDTKLSALQRCKAMARLIVGLQHKLTFRIIRTAFRRPT
jgi:hypothetical protein